MKEARELFRDVVLFHSQIIIIFFLLRKFIETVLWSICMVLGYAVVGTQLFLSRRQRYGGAWVFKFSLITVAPVWFFFLNSMRKHLILYVDYFQNKLHRNYFNVLWAFLAHKVQIRSSNTSSIIQAFLAKVIQFWWNESWAAF